jgi:hypothetical protein
MAVMNQIGQALADIVVLLQKEEPDEDKAIDTALIDALSRLQLPQPAVSFSPQITVQPANVVIMPAETSGAPQGGWRLSIVGRDGADRIRDILIKPE